MPKIPPIPFCEEIPSCFELGKTREEIKLSNTEESRHAALSLAEQARYEINIFTQDLDDAIYNNEEFEHHIFNLAARHRNSKIRILVQNSSAAIKKGHRLIHISQKLTSSIFIRNPPEIHKSDESSFMTVDGIGMLYRAQTNNYNYVASVNFMSPRRTKKLEEFFNESWENSLPDQHVRRLCI